MNNTETAEQSKFRYRQACLLPVPLGFTSAAGLNQIDRIESDGLFVVSPRRMAA